MKLHSDTLNESSVYASAEIARKRHGADIYVCDSVQRGSRKRDHSVEFHCASEHGRYATNGGTSTTLPRGRMANRAASWSDWGYMLAELFALDPEAIIGTYNGVDDFRHQCEEWPGRTDAERAFLGVLA